MSEIKMMLVEDDFVVRQGIHYSVEWETYGIDICAEAANGRDGLRLAKVHQPDLIITDIRMPIMDGLQFTEELRALQPDTCIVILSGYDDFAYAKRAIHMGVNEYLLKPIDADELLKCVLRLKDEICARKLKDVRQNNQQKLVESLRPEIHGNLLRKIVQSNFPEKSEKTLASLSYYGITFSASEYLAAILSVENYLLLMQNHTEEEQTELVTKIHTAVRECFEDFAVAEAFENEEHQFGILLNFEPVTDAYLKERCVKLSERIHSDTGFYSTVSCGKRKRRVEELCISYEEAVASLKNRMEDSKYGQLVKEAIDYTEKHYREPLSVKSVSSELFITPNYFSQIFKAQTGDNYTDYVNKVRIRRAILLLKDPKQKVYEVAEQVGYQNYKYFNTVFKKITGLSPKEYRNQGL